MSTNDFSKLNEQDVPASSSSIVKLIPHLAFFVALIVSCVVWLQTKKHFDIIANERFVSRTAMTKSKIENRMLDYEQVLRSCVAFHDSSTEVSRMEWKQYLASCKTQTWYPGIQCIGVAVPIAKQDVTAFEKSIRQEGFPEFKISPPENRQVYTAIKFIEPFDWRNRRAFGYDMYSNPIRRKAMDRAAETGLLSISGKITLVQETGDDVQSGILCYLPIYRTGASVQTVAERKLALTGWVYAAFRCNDLVDGILRNHSNKLSLKIYDTQLTAAENLLFENQPLEQPAGSQSVEASHPLLSSVVPINLSGRTWTMRLEARPGAFVPEGSFFSSVVGVVGVLISSLLYVVLLSFTRQRARAIELAGRMTRGFLESEQKTRSILENASEAILSVSDDGKISAANRAAHTAFSVPSSLINASIDDFLVKTKFSEMAKRCRASNGSVLTTCRKANGDEFKCSVSIGEVTHNDNLQYIVVARDETARIAAAEKLAEKNRELVLASRNAGMAEVATGVLHNVGNVLNSINVSTTVLKEKLKSSSLSSLEKAVDLLKQHDSDLVEFLTEHERGKHFPKFIHHVTKALISERDSKLSEVESLVKNVEHIRVIVTSQQASARCSRIIEQLQIAALIDSAIKVNEEILARHDVQLITEVCELPTVVSEQHSILQILINLIKNAVEASCERESSIVTVTAIKESRCVRIDIEDNGVGISPEQINSLFQHGFTTKPDGHGFGLHASAITASELGGSLSVHSDGLNKGATFTLRIPLSQTQSSFPTMEPGILMVDPMPDSFCGDILQGN